MRICKHDCLGRSMVEMIGVLALVGLLSVGAVALIFRAMEKYKVNTLINQVTQIVSNSRNFFGQYDGRDYASLDFNVQKMSLASYKNRKIADSTRLFPEEIRKNGYKTVYGGEIQYFADGRYKDNDGRAFILEFYGIPREACIEIVTKDWNASLGLIGMKVKSTVEAYSIQTGALTGKCKTQYKKGVGLFCAEDFPITVGQAAMVCDYEKNNNISWKFY